MGVGTAGFTIPFQKSLGYQQITGIGGTAVGFSSIPAGASSVVIYVEGAAIRWRDDGTAPTASVGMPVSAGQDFSYAGPMSAIEFIAQSGTAIVNATFYA